MFNSFHVSGNHPVAIWTYFFSIKFMQVNCDTAVVLSILPEIFDPL